MHFKVETREIADSFLEILGHKFEGAKYKLEIHGADYKNFNQTKHEGEKSHKHNTKEQ